MSPLCRRIVALIDLNIDVGQQKFRMGLDLRGYDRTLGAVLCLEELRGKVIEEDRKDDFADDPDDQDPQPTVADLVADEDPE